MYINDLSDNLENLESNSKLFADDTSVFCDPIMILIKLIILIKLVFGPTNGKCSSVQINLNNLKR